MHSPQDSREEIPARLKRDRMLSSLVTRIFFFLLLIADLAWAAYVICLFMWMVVGMVVTFGQVAAFTEGACSSWISVKRSLVCGLSLFLALFSPAFGIMIACTYFVMYDKAGIEEVIPSSLQEQFKEFLSPGE